MNTGMVDKNGLEIKEGNNLIDKQHDIHRVIYDKVNGYMLLDVRTGMFMNLNQALAGKMLVVEELEPLKI